MVLAFRVRNSTRRMSSEKFPVWLAGVVLTVVGLGKWRVVPSLLVSLAYIVGYIMCAEVTRRHIADMHLRRRAHLLKSALTEAVTTAEMCATSFELIIISDNYGVLAYSVLLFVVSVTWTVLWKDTTACTYVPMELWMQGRMKLKESLFCIFAQICGGLAIFPLVSLLWSLEAGEFHVVRCMREILNE